LWGQGDDHKARGEAVEAVSGCRRAI
jgi:hypothetical protein